MQNLIVKITQQNDSLLDKTDIGCFILEDNTNTEFATAFIRQAHTKNKLVLICGENALITCKNLSADGIIADTSKETNPKKIIKELQKKSTGLILGIITRNRRHEAMIVSECEPDFVIFKVWQNGLDENAELLNWYNELFLIQSAALVEDEVDLNKIKADFLILDEKKYKIYVAK